MSQIVPRGLVEARRGRQLLLVGGLAVACGGVVSREPDASSSPNGAGGDTNLPGGKSPSGGKAATGNPSPSGGKAATGNPSPSGGKAATNGNVGDSPLGGGGQSGEPSYYDGGNMAGGAAPPAFVCASSDVLKHPTEAARLARDGGRIERIVTDEQGNSYVVGWVDNPFPIGPYQGPDRLFLMKVDAHGTQTWSKDLGARSDRRTDRIASLVRTANGELVLGISVDHADPTDPAAPSLSMTALRLNPEDGTQLAELVVPARSDTRLQEIVVVGSDLYFAGTFVEELSVGATKLTGTGGAQPFVLRFGNDGEVLGAVNLGSEAHSDIRDVVADPLGNLYLATVSSADVEKPGRILALSSSLDVRWERDVGKDTFPARLALDGEQLVVVGDAVVGATMVETMVVEHLDADLGDTVVRHELPLGSVGPATLTSLMVLPDGSLVIGGQGRTGSKLGDFALRSVVTPSALLLQLSPDDEPLWATLYCADGVSQIKDLSYAVGTLRALIAFEGYLELGSAQLARVADYDTSMPSAGLLAFELTLPSEDLN